MWPCPPRDVHDGHVAVSDAQRPELLAVRERVGEQRARVQGVHPPDHVQGALGVLAQKSPQILAVGPLEGRAVMVAITSCKMKRLKAQWLGST